MTAIGSVVLTTAALASHGFARTPYGGVRHVGYHGSHVGGAMPGSGHHSRPRGR